MLKMDIVWFWKKFSTLPPTLFPIPWYAFQSPIFTNFVQQKRAVCSQENVPENNNSKTAITKLVSHVS